MKAIHFYKKIITAGMIGVLLSGSLIGCGNKQEAEVQEETDTSNVVLSETGEEIQVEEIVTPVAEKVEPTPYVNPDAVVTDEPEQEQVIGEEDQVEPTESELQVVFLGDSIFDNARDGSGIPYLTSVACNADCYNLAIGGTSATVEHGEEQSSEEWTSRSLCGIVKAIVGDIPTDIFQGTRAQEIIDNPKVDLSQTDYFVIEYGMNDFFRGVSQSNPEEDYDLTTYAGALRYAASNLSEYAPDATIILCAPNYAQFFNGNQFIGDGNSLNNGAGTLFDYKGTCNYVANEQQTLFFNAYQDLGIDSYTADEYLEDGVHLSEAGRKLYADALSQMILNYEETKNN